MIEIKHRYTGAVLHTVDADTLSGADLRWADLSGVDLRGADLRWADLSGVDLRGADLRGADLREANLSGADLREAILSDANLSGANLREADLPAFQIPQEGELIVYKKLTNRSIAKLRIPPGAKRTASLTGRKCRAEFAEVLELSEGAALDIHSHTLQYGVGERVYPDRYDDDIRVECTHGIHFFLTREEAEAY